MRGKTYAPEFKLKLVQQVLSGEKRPAQLCREHNIVTPCVHRTTKRSCSNGGTPLPKRVKPPSNPSRMNSKSCLENANWKNELPNLSE